MKKNNKGFTLIDVVCATAILALVALPICSGFLTAAKSNQRISEKAETVNLLNNELSLILASGKVSEVSVFSEPSSTPIPTPQNDPQAQNSENSENSENGENAKGEDSSNGIVLSETVFENEGSVVYEKTISDKKVKITLKPTFSIVETEKVAYITVWVSCGHDTADETEDDFEVSGVWTK